MFAVHALYILDDTGKELKIPGIGPLDQTEAMNIGLHLIRAGRVKKVLIVLMEHFSKEKWSMRTETVLTAKP